MAAIRRTPEVRARWHGDDIEAELLENLDDEDLEVLVVETLGGDGGAGEVIGSIQWYEEADDDYRHAGMDLYLDPSAHGRGHGSDAVATLARHLIETVGHHRLVIDPAADNVAAIRCYEKVGFKPVGVMRRYERDAEGDGWHDGLLMDLLAEELVI
ncbi:MAG: GNAT family protein [Actinomycetota bacterium]|nr:GNAT family protein [Actinomycetota bacterium]